MTETQTTEAIARIAEILATTTDESVKSAMRLALAQLTNAS